MKPILLITLLTLAFLPAWAQVPAKPKAPGKADPGAQPVSKVHAKLEQTVLPKFEVKEALLADCVKALSDAVKAADPKKTGVEIRLAPELKGSQTKVTLALKDVPALEALKFIVTLADVKFVSTDTVCEIVPRTK